MSDPTLPHLQGVRPEAVQESIRQGAVKLVSDGTVRGTFVLMPDGTPIPGIKRIEFEAEVGDALPELRLYFSRLEAEIGDAS